MRFGHTAVPYKHFMYVFGGWDGAATLFDIVVLDMKTENWIELSVKGKVKGRYRHSAVVS